MVRARRRDHRIRRVGRRWRGRRPAVGGQIGPAAHPGGLVRRRTPAMVNQWVLIVFAPALVAVGVLGFVPRREGSTSAAPAYNVFHIVFGVIGLAVVLFGGNGPARTFNVAFGLIDLYQALASRLGWFPVSQFRWKPADDVLHVVIGTALVLVGLVA